MMNIAGIADRDNGVVSRILAVDDDEINLEIVQELLENEGYIVDTAKDGIEAQKMLLQHPEKYHTVVLDWMMPKMNGLQLLQMIKSHPILAAIPVIMQTAKATNQDIKKGLDGGVIYYLTKPFQKHNLLAIVDTAVASYFNHILLCQEIDDNRLLKLEDQTFHFRTLDEGRSLATLLAAICPLPKRVIPGLSELFVNAIEHGNLDIGYSKKTELQALGRWLEEVEYRLTLPEYADRQVTVTLETDENQIQFTITDQGDGFDYADYLEINPARAINTHGRGIAIARAMCFDRMEFMEPGNSVVVTVNKELRNNG